MILSKIFILALCRSWSWMPSFYSLCNPHDDVIKWKHFPRNWPFVREIHRSPVNFPHKGQWRGALMFSLIYAWINDWVNNREAGDLRRHHGHYDVIIMLWLRYLQTWYPIHVILHESEISWESFSVLISSYVGNPLIISLGGALLAT